MNLKCLQYNTFINNVKNASTFHVKPQWLTILIICFVQLGKMYNWWKAFDKNLTRPQKHFFSCGLLLLYSNYFIFFSNFYFISNFSTFWKEVNRTNISRESWGSNRGWNKKSFYNYGFFMIAFVLLYPIYLWLFSF